MRKQRKTNWKYKNLSIFILILLVVFVLSDTGVVDPVLEWIGKWGYAGALMTGVFFVSLFTVVPASLVLLSLAQESNPLLIALSAGLGASIGDLLLFRFFKDGLFDELRSLFRHSQFSRFARIFKTRLFLWFTPLIGAFIIASPFPDEVGIGLLGLSNIRPWQFLALSLVLNSAGIFAIVSVF